MTLLTEAAELEHQLMCAYLYTAYSLKRRRDEGLTWAQLEKLRRWEASITVVARQEMEHLGLVCNLLTAIGEAPRLTRPNFPLRPKHYELHIELDLAPLSEEVLRNFVKFEMPDVLTDSEQEQLANEGIHDVDQYRTIARLYDEIEHLFELLGPGVFIGPPGAQLVTTDVVPVTGSIRGLALPPDIRLYDVQLDTVTSLPTAKAVIKRIKEEGEGAPSSEATLGPSHFERLLTILSEFEAERRRDPSFNPARPVTTAAATDPHTRRASQFFDHAYETLLLLLTRFFSHTDEGADAVNGLMRAAFFPMMTGVIRPAAELLTELPSGDGEHTAAPGFRITRNIILLPHRLSAWTIIQGELDGLAITAESLAGDPGYPEPLRARLGLMRENLGRIALDFGLAMRSEVAP